MTAIIHLVPEARNTHRPFLTEWIAGLQMLKRPNTHVCYSRIKLCMQSFLLRPIFPVSALILYFIAKLQVMLAVSFDILTVT